MESIVSDLLGSTVSPSEIERAYDITHKEFKEILLAHEVDCCVQCGTWDYIWNLNEEKSGLKCHWCYTQPPELS